MKPSPRGGHRPRPAAAQPAPPAAPAPAGPTAVCERARRDGEGAVDWLVATGRLLGSAADPVREEEAREGDAAVLRRYASRRANDAVAEMTMREQGTGSPALAAGLFSPTVQDVLRRPLAVSGRNPLVEQARADGTAGEGPAPTLFPGGDLPAFTASGIDPRTLLQVPWQARHPMAQATTTGSAYAILSACAGADGDLHADMHYGQHEGNRDYQMRVRQWQESKPLTQSELNKLLGDRVKDQVDEYNRRWSQNTAPARAAAAARHQRVLADEAAETKRRRQAEIVADANARRAREQGGPR